MQVLSRGATTACRDCGAAVDRRATWCGRCGALVDDTGPEDRKAVARASVPRPQSQQLRVRWVVAALVVVAVVALLLAAPPADAPTDVMLGRMDATTGVSSTTPPPEDLQLAWVVDRPGSSARLDWPAVLDQVAGDDRRVQVGAWVVDSRTGAVARVLPDLVGNGQVTKTVRDGDELLVLDLLSGDVLHRGALPAVWDRIDPWTAHRSGRSTLLSGEHGSALVRDDGTVVAELAQIRIGSVDRAWGEAEAHPVRAFDYESWDGGDDRLWAPLTLLDASTGVERLALPGDRARVADVMGDLALVASTTALSQQALADLGQLVEWSVLLVDAATGTRLHRFEVVASPAPRLLGRLGDGRPVVAVAGVEGLDLVAVTPDGSTSTLLRVEEAVIRLPQGRASLPAAVLVDDLLVVAERDRLVARRPDGEVVWEAAASVSELRSAGAHVVTLEEDGARRVRRASDGAVVASVPQLDEQWVGMDARDVPIAAVDGAVGLGQVSEQPGERLSDIHWFDLRTGAGRSATAVVDRFLPAGLRTETGWMFHGLVVDEGDVVEPLLTRAVPGAVEVLDPHVGVEVRPLPEDEGGQGRSSQTYWLVGADVDRLVLTIRLPGDPSEPDVPWRPPRYATHIVDRLTGTAATVAGIRGVSLAGDVVLGEEVDDHGRALVLVGLDAATGDELWSIPPTAPWTWSGSVLADASLVLVRGVAQITARAPLDGTVRWRYRSPVELSQLAVLGSAHVVVTTTDGRVVALDREDGVVAWSTDLGVPVTALSGAGDHVLAATLDGEVVHLDRRGGVVQRTAVDMGPVHRVHALGSTVVVTTATAVVGLRAETDDAVRRDEVAPAG